MGVYSDRSRKRLATCCDELQLVMYSIIARHDHTILRGASDKLEQNQLFTQGRSKLQYPQSKHCIGPEAGRDRSDAVDAAPWIKGVGIPWPPALPADGVITTAFLMNYSKRLGQFYVFAGYVLEAAYRLNVQLRWGGDWDRDDNLMDQRFDDLVHFEVVR